MAGASAAWGNSSSCTALSSTIPGHRQLTHIELSKWTTAYARFYSEDLKLRKL